MADKNSPLVSIAFVIAASLGLGACQTMTSANLAENGGCKPVIEDFKNYVSGGKECLALETRSLTKTGDKANHLFIFLHGDGGGKETSEFIRTSVLNKSGVKNYGVILTLMYRPGYGNGVVKSSGYYSPDGKGDSYTKENVESVMKGISRLADHYQPEKITVLGKSGGAAIIANGVGLFPELAPDEIILAACPCNLTEWAHHRNWRDIPVSVSPHSVIDSIPASVRIVAITSQKDTNTIPAIAERYVSRLKAAGKNAHFLEAPNGGHDVVLYSDEIGLVVSDSLNVNAMPFKPTRNY